jgi:hypothetical protein
VRAAPLARRGCRRRRARVAQRRSYAPWSRTRRRRARRVRAPWCVRRARGGGTLNLMKCAKKAPVSSDKTSTETKNTAHHASSHMVLGNFTLRANSLKNIECENKDKKKSLGSLARPAPGPPAHCETARTRRRACHSDARSASPRTHELRTSESLEERRSRGGRGFGLARPRPILKILPR